MPTLQDRPKWTDNNTTEKKGEVLTSVLQKRGGACFYESEVLNSTFVYLMKLCDKSPALRKAAKR